MSDAPKPTTAADLQAALLSDESPHPALERLARVLAAGTDEAARKVMKVEWDSPIDALRSWGIETTRRLRDSLTEALRRVLAELVTRNADKLGPDIAATLRPWIEQDANIEALAEWLEKGGWDKVDGDKVEARLVAAAHALLAVDNPPAGLTCLSMPLPDGACVLVFDVPRSDKDKPAVQQRIERLTKPHIDTLAKLMMPQGWKPPEKVEVLLGLDALKAGLADHAWAGIFDCLTDKAGTDGDWLRLLALAWLDERQADLKERLERQAGAVELVKAPAVHTRGRKYGRLPKVAAGMSWAFGGPGVELARVKVDGREYAPAPDLAIAQPAAALVPAGYALLPADHAKRPHQTLLPIDTDGAEDAPPLPVALADATQYAIAPAGGKLGLLIMAAAHESRGRLHKTTLRELTQTINPDARLVRTHFETVCKVLPQLDGLRLVLPNGMAYRVFECPIPWRELTPEEYDAPLFVGLTRTFERTLAAIQDTAGASYRGDFLFDLTGAMKLPTRRPGLVRQYIRACAFWNAYWKPGTSGEPDPARVPEVSAERWAILTNYLTPAAEEYLRTKGKGNRRRLSDVLRDTLEDAEYLADEARLVKIDRADRRAVRLLWRPEYLEAWHESRKGAHKIPGNAPEA